MNSKSIYKLTIVVVCLLCLAIFSCSVFASNETIDASRSVSQTKIIYDDGNDGVVGVYVIGTSLYPYVSDSHFDSYMNRDVITVSQEYIYMIRISNSTDDYYTFNRGLVRFNVSRIEYPSDVTNGNYISNISSTGYQVGQIYGDLLSSFNCNTAGAFTGYINSKYSYNSAITLPPHSNVYSFFTVTDTNTFSGTFNNINFDDVYNKLDRYVLAVSISDPSSASVNNDASLYNADVNSYYTNETINKMYADLVNIKSQTVSINSHVSTIDSNVQSIRDSYNQANNTYDNSSGQQIKQDAESKAQTIETIHDSEMQYYNQNKQAIEDTGLTNFNYTPEQISSFSVLITDFNNLWNALDGWTFVYTFSLMLSLALLIIRHKPMTRDKGGGKDA